MTLLTEVHAGALSESDFWFGFAMGAATLSVIYFVVTAIVSRARPRSNGPGMVPPVPGSTSDTTTLPPTNPYS